MRLVRLIAMVLLCAAVRTEGEESQKSDRDPNADITPWSSKNLPSLDHKVCLGDLGTFDRKKVDEFLEILGEALTKKDFRRLNDCFYWNDTPQPVRDQAIWEFEELLRDQQIYAINILRLEDKRLARSMVKRSSSGKVMNGRRYDPNLKPVMMAVMLFGDTTSQQAQKWVPIGITPEGLYRFVGTKVGP